MLTLTDRLRRHHFSPLTTPCFRTRECCIVDKKQQRLLSCARRLRSPKKAQIAQHIRSTPSHTKPAAFRQPLSLFALREQHEVARYVYSLTTAVFRSSCVRSDKAGRPHLHAVRTTSPLRFAPFLHPTSGENIELCGVPLNAPVLFVRLFARAFCVRSGDAKIDANKCAFLRFFCFHSI
jgi:hypothetical protein